MEDISINHSYESPSEYNNIIQLKKLFKKIFYENKKSLKSFLIMHNENKSLATWALQSQPKIFGITKNKIKIKDFENDIKSINPNITINVNAPKKSL